MLRSGPAVRAGASRQRSGRAGVTSRPGARARYGCRVLDDDTPTPSAATPPLIADPGSKAPSSPGLSTIWGDALDRTRPFPEYPRPALARDAWLSLNGSWDYAICPATPGRSIARQAVPDHWDGAIIVPFAVETAASGVGRGLLPSEYLAYRRTVTVPWAGRVAINFEAVDYECAVFADGQLLGTHRGGYLPFSFDLPDVDPPTPAGSMPSAAGTRQPDVDPSARAGRAREVELVVLVRDPSDTGLQQRGKQVLKPGGIMYTATSGIWQSVWLEPLPEVAITRVLATTLPDRAGWRFLVEAGPTHTIGVGEGVGVEGDGAGGATGCPTHTVGEKGGEGGGGDRGAEAVDVVVHLESGTVTASGRTGTPIEVRVPEPHLWSTADPHLYPVTVTTAGDRIATYAALRAVEWGPIPGAAPDQKPAVLLNGRAIFPNTPLSQGYWPESGLTAPSDEALAFDLEQMRDLGFNGVRTHIKVESRRFYWHADRLGMLVVQDAVNGGRNGTTFAEGALIQATGRMRGDRSRRDLARTGRTALAGRREFEAELLAMIRLLEVHPSIVMWVPFNESWGQFESLRIEAAVRAADPTRLIDHASGWHDQGGGDVRSRHRYVLPLIAPPARDPRPFYLSEFGGYTLPVSGHVWEDGSWGYRAYRDGEALAAAYRHLFEEQLVPLIARGLRGAVYTQLSDVESEANGLFTYDRKVLKLPRKLIRELNAAVDRAFEALGSEQ